MSTAPAELVLVTYLKSLSSLSNCGVSTVLPKIATTDTDNNLTDNWGGLTRWITVSVIAGRIVPNLPMRRPALTITAWARPARMGSSKTPWGVASSIASTVFDATIDWYTNVRLTMPYAGYDAVSISSLAPLGEPRRALGDESGLAKYLLDVELVYTKA